MPKAARKKYYAVRRGREGPRIYDTWDECKANVTRFPDAAHKSFNARAAAEAWIKDGGYTLPPPSEHISSRSNASSMCGGDAAAVNSMSSIPAGGSNSTAQPKPSEQPTQAAPPAPQTSATLTTGALSTSIRLSPEQQQVLNKVKAGESVFFTGSAGTGKSVLLREIIRFCRESGRQVAITASTGIAAVNIGGSTVHSWAGIGLGKEEKEKLAGKILGQDKLKRAKDKQRREDQGLPLEDEYDYDDSAEQTRVVQRWRNVHTLIIDEISMIDGKLFDKLEYVARILRRNPKPFGGIQVILSGDFCQLPPVPDKGNNGAIPMTFAFDAESWDACVGKPICLKKVFRQKDQVFVDMLNAMRFGQLSPEMIKAFRALSREVTYSDGIEPTELYPRRDQVSTANSRRLQELQTQPRQYKASDMPGYDDNGYPLQIDKMKRLLERLVAEETLVLKEGAQVMLIKNLVQGQLVNGSMGKVVGFLRTRDAVQRGLKIGVADAPKPAGPARRGAPDAPAVPERVLRSDGLWPLVRFDGGGEVLCVPSTFEVNNADGGVEATREQVPLILAWALSIHKSQGQTLERVRVDLGRVFEKGQAYVALSRATSMKTLEVKGFDLAKVMAHERVLEWTRANTSLSVPPPRPRDDIDEVLEFWED
ncbi:ATP-dependent DNA helicase PIF1 [Phanerochaete sordida]|uniref:ATP-dependent DNA helicase PIF1 n=1 Tax=Phanerochaete sordida TaxID=48140 RepID=A0A9P3G2I0_9APHY|nr:ATP-dependent DNA helicase PIF1 [Phanerochaete sordida]